MKWSTLHAPLGALLMMSVIAVPAVAKTKSSTALTAPLTADAVNDSALAPPADGDRGGGVLRAQVLLDRAHFSPGEIDGVAGKSLRTAVRGFQKANGLSASGQIDAKTWEALNRDTAPALITYTIIDTDVAGPFQAVPTEMMEKAALPAMGYASAAELLGEKFHVRPEFLTQLNPGKDLSRAGEDILVPNVDAAAALPKAAKVVVDKSDSTVSLVDEQDKTIAQFPASSGSEHDPLPLGTWKIKGVASNPVFRYNPALFWDADSTDTKTIIQPGPNNPVGVVWVDLSVPHYGIHGTPEPRSIGKTESHGCIRLTNWDALKLSQAVRPGMPAILQK